MDVSVRAIKKNQNLSSAADACWTAVRIGACALSNKATRLTRTLCDARQEPSEPYRSSTAKKPHKDRLIGAFHAIQRIGLCFA